VTIKKADFVPGLISSCPKYWQSRNINPHIRFAYQSYCLVDFYHTMRGGSNGCSENVEPETLIPSLSKAALVARGRTVTFIWSF
jgi:hypothetical protein